MFESSVFSSEYETLDKIMVASNTVMIILFRSTKLSGVFLSLRAFLKSLMMLLKFWELELLDEKVEPATEALLPPEFWNKGLPATCY